MNRPPDSPPTRLGVFYDGGWLHHLGQYFSRHSQWKARPSFAGIHDLMRWYVSRVADQDVHDIVVTEKHYVRGRGADPSSTFDAVLEREGIHRHDVRYNRHGEKGADVLLALEAFHRALEGAYDIAVLITGDADFVPLVERLHRLDVWVVIPDIVATYLDDAGKKQDIKCGRALIQAVDHAPAWEHLFEEALKPGYDLTYPFIWLDAQFDGSEIGPDGYRHGSISRWEDGSPYGFITDTAGRAWYVSRDQLVGQRESLPLYQPVAFLGDPVVPAGKSHPPALGIRPVPHTMFTAPPMDDLVEFLRARMSEDEQVASQYEPDGPWKAGEEPGRAPLEKNIAAYLSRLSPGRVLADIEAKREILRLHEGGPDGRCPTCSDESPCTTLRLLAEVYLDHPDYRTEWGA
ncbi:DUF6221 family protein [Actinomadura sp. NPDC047616]|uniref:DUF6221 family protein n=1 Tax=Actinomadura sp. NPDC047616 TaxID=3155914 RepID=UPI0033C5AFAA